MADQHGAKIMNFNELRRKAIAFLEAAKDGAVVMKMTEENARLQQQITELNSRLAENDKRFAQLQEQIDGSNANSSNRPNSRK
jgi:septal ring factor EnvC (AmiA/AmiB activator)